MIPKQLKREMGIKYLLVAAKQKIPLEQNWQKSNNYDAEDPRLIKHLKNGGNYGVLCGNGLIVMDADTPEFEEIIKKELPKTFSVETSKGKHYYYYCIDFPNKKVLKKGDSHLGEIQSTGTFVIGANSTHPSGKKYNICEDIEIKELKKKDIDLIFGAYYSSSIINKDVILKGSSSGLRNESMFKLACSFRAKNMEVEEVFIVLKSINEKNDPPLPEYELQNIVKSAFKYENENKFENKENKINSVVNKWNDYFDLANKLWKEKPFFYDETGNWWEWDLKLCCWKITDEINLFNFIDDCINQPFTIKSKFKTELIEALKRLGRRKVPKDAPAKWIQFKDMAYSISSGEIYKVTPDYLFCNPIPWEIGETSETPTMDKMFEEWVGKEYVQTLYEILAYCCYTDYPIHRIFAFVGGGCNGKSTYQQLLRNFIGVENCTATELDVLLDSRFESAKLFKKLACIMGETNFGVMSKTSLLKKLSGQDLIGYEFKNKMPFEAINYSKLLINSNSMPTSDDTSEGFFRRWLIIDFPNKFKEGRDILADIPDVEYNNLAKKITEILPNVLAKGGFSNEGTIEEREEKYISVSNPLSLFIKNCCEEKVDGFIRYSEFYTAYVQFLKANKRRIVSKREFITALEMEGYEIRRTSKKIGDDFISDRYIEHICLYDNYDVYDNFSNSFPRYKKLVEKNVINVINVTKNKKEIINFIKKQPKNNAWMLEEAFGEIIINKMLQSGEIIEMPKGSYKTV